MGRGPTVQVQGQQEGEVRTGGFQGDKDNKWALYDQGHSTGTARELDTMGRRRQQKYQDGKPVNDPTGKAQLPHLGNIQHTSLPTEPTPVVCGPAHPVRLQGCAIPRVQQVATHPSPKKTG